MKSINRMIRSYLEIHGTFKGIEKEKTFPIIEKGLIEWKEQTEEINNDSTIAELLLLTLGGIKPKRISRKKISETRDAIPHSEYVELISAFLRNSQALQITTVNQETRKVSDLLYANTLARTKTEATALLNEKSFKECLKILIPTWTKSDKVEGLINMGKLYYNKNLSIAERNEIVKSAVLDASFNILKLPLDIRFEAIAILDKGITQVGDTDIVTYMKIVNLAHSNGFTVKEFLEVLGYNHIDFLNQVETLGFTATIQTLTATRITNLETDNFLILNNEDYKNLYERDVLRSLKWVQGIPYVTTTTRIELSKLLGKGADGKDFRR